MVVAKWMDQKVLRDETAQGQSKEGLELLEEDVGEDHILGADEQCQELEDSKIKCRRRPHGRITRKRGWVSKSRSKP